MTSTPRALLDVKCGVEPAHLWSLYAEKHRGVAFEVKYSWKDDQIQKMTYSNERPVLDFDQLRKHHNAAEREEHLKTLLRCLMNQKSLGFAPVEFRLWKIPNHDKPLILQAFYSLRRN